LKRLVQVVAQKAHAAQAYSPHSPAAADANRVGREEVRGVQFDKILTAKGPADLERKPKSDLLFTNFSRVNCDTVHMHRELKFERREVRCANH
jgi:hypothetical protein